jgi:zinc transport system substrate-binding protein
MKNISKIIKSAFGAVAVLFLLVAINSNLFAKAKKSDKKSKASKLSIVTTIFPEYDWVRQLLGDKNQNTELTLLLGNGVDLHSYQPSIQDVAKISTADIFIFVGGESDGWVKDALKNAKNKEMIVLNLMEILGDKVKEEEIVEGMEGEEEEEDEHDHDHDDADENHHHHHDDEEAEYDEHVWLSLKNAKVICEKITEALCQKDSKNKVTYQNNLSEYLAQLNELDWVYSSVINNASKDTLIFGDRFPFRYLVDDYNLNYYAAFVGCSAETEASFKTVIFLSSKMDELDSNYIFKIESSDDKLAKTIIQNSGKKNAQVLILNSMQSVTSKQAEDTSYIKIMSENLQTLQKGLE